MDGTTFLKVTSIYYFFLQILAFPTLSQSAAPLIYAEIVVLTFTSASEAPLAFISASSHLNSFASNDDAPLIERPILFALPFISISDAPEILPFNDVHFMLMSNSEAPDASKNKTLHVKLLNSISEAPERYNERSLQSKLSAFIS